MPEELNREAFRRRGWLIALVVVISAVAAYGVAQWRGRSFEAEALLVVASTSSPSPGNADQADRLAVSYAGVIATDAKLSRLAATASGEASVRLTAKARRESALLDVHCSTGSAASAKRCIGAVARGVTGASPVSTGIAPSSLKSLGTQGPPRPSSGRYVQTLTLIVPAGTTMPSVNSDQSTKLAVTYAGLIPNDDSVKRFLARSIGETPKAVAGGLTAVNDANTGLIHLTYKDADAHKAYEGVRGLARALAAADPASDRITPGTLKVADLPDDVPHAGGLVTPLLSAVVFGLLLGFVVVIAWERADPRLDDVDDLARELGRPATSADTRTLHVLRKNIDSVIGNGNRSVLVMPTDASMTGDTRKVVHALDRNASVSGAPLEVHQLAPVEELGADLLGQEGAVILLARVGSRARRVREIVETLRRFGLEPVWGLLVPPGRLQDLPGEDARTAQAPVHDQPGRAAASVEAGSGDRW